MSFKTKNWQVIYQVKTAQQVSSSIRHAIQRVHLCLKQFKRNRHDPIRQHQSTQDTIYVCLFGVERHVNAG
jgi:hypothetical protein